MAPLGIALDQATADYLENNRIPGRSVGELDNRGSMYYLATYWAQAIAAQTTDSDLADRFKPVAAALADNETEILKELASTEGHAQDLAGYYRPDAEKAEAAMRPSSTLNEIIGGV